LNYKKNISLENFFGEFFTDSFGEGRFCPDYYIDSSDEENVNIYLDCPGIIKITKAEINKYILNVKGKREKNNNNIKTMGRKFCSGEFEIKIMLQEKDRYIDDEEPIKITDLKNGFFLFQIKREKNNE
jgi:HSP20 family molecular chaperone IbpA